VDNGKSVDIFYLDFAKAFDKVPHKRLMVKVKAKGISGKIYNWIEEWLTGRTQSVVVGRAESTDSQVESGVPQGTVMGPPLFTIFIDDIDDVVKLVELLIKFADDNKGMKIIESEADREKLQKTLDNLCEWANKWEMQFNVAKCKIMHVGRGNPCYKYYMNGTELQTVDEETDVGVVIHKSLKPTRQCEKAANTARAVLGLVQRNFHYRDRKVYMKLYKQYVRPHLEFSSPAWAPWSVRETELLEAVQKKAVGMVSGLKARTYESRCKELGIQTLTERRQEQDLAQVFRFRNQIGGLNAETMFERIPARDGPVTRLAGGGNNLKLPAARLDIRKNSFAVRTVNKWNDLPDQIKAS
jgi:ribonucleases P/MRP protein subunit RPP40